MAPRNAAQERARLVSAWESGDEAAPRWSYARTDHAELRAALEEETRRLEEEETPLGRAYAARAAELALEAALASAVGTPEVGPLAAKRFGSGDGAAAREAMDLAHEWIALAPEPPGDEIPSDADEDSLLSMLREAVGRLKLPFSVFVQPALSSLAATGDRVIVVAAGRRLTIDDARRTVMHEIEAHAVPRARAARLELRLFAIGTARGTDDQEGLALTLEQRHGFLSVRRRRELAARHLAVRAMRDGATFVDVVRKMHRDWGFSAREAVLVSERTFRGGDGVHAGLGREIVYLESMIRVRAHLANRPTDEAVLASGQVSLDAIPALAPFATWERE